MRGNALIDEQLSKNPQYNKRFQECLDEMEKLIVETEDKGKKLVLKEHGYQLMFPPTFNAHLDKPLEETPLPKMVDHSLDIPVEKRKTSNSEEDESPSLPIPNPTYIPDRLFITFKPVLIIRHPALAIPSYLRAAAVLGGTVFDEDMVVETQYKWQRLIYDCYKAWYDSKGMSGAFPVVIDGDKLINDTQSQMTRLCELIGVEPSGIQYSWDVKDQFENKVSESFIGTIGRSTGVIRKEENRVPLIAEEAEKWAGEWDQDTAEKMRFYAEKAMPDYQYLLERSI
ncbi:hypothetical protein V5O48_009076 [Marasmius crinis-equi]|uniref:Sulfotransferase n=1 Tax=Marasmius crinis-equi TaxID=585013 RepID=A0ABR3FC49_9AGAR